MVRVMSDYIKKEDAERMVAGMKSADGLSAVKALGVIPSADVAPVRHGHWVVIDAEEPRRYGCSECKRLSWHMENYCPNCGAKMDEDEDPPTYDWRDEQEDYDRWGGTDE